jgi:hypothetical protein
MLERVKSARFLTDFDSGVNTVRAVGGFLHGEDHRALNMGPASHLLADSVATSPPDRVRAALYRAMGFQQAIPLDRARRVNVDEYDQWVVKQYDKGPYAVVVLGSPSGGVTHLAAALGAPYLPQTTLTGVRDLATQSDDAVGAMQALAPTTRLIAQRNPRVAVYHMHDPAQDRPMLEAMAYMRLKRLQLGDVYERFLEQSLDPGGTILQVECTRDWRTRAVGERAYFQFGCLGGVPEDEYHDTGERIAQYLEQEDAPVRRWEPPEMDARRPEAEWGFDRALSEDVAQFADRLGYRVKRLVSGEPQEHSPFVADLHRWWYARLGRPTDRLMVESYVQWDPMVAIETGSVPFWLRFNMEPAYDELREYLERTDPYEHIHLNLFSQGIESPGVVPVERWASLVQQHARVNGEIVGVDRDTYPMDAGSTIRYTKAFKRAIPARYPLPEPLCIDDIDRFIDEADRDHPVRWE